MGDEDDPVRIARELFQEAYRYHLAGEYEAAIHLYDRSVQARPTAEAFTFRAWAKSALGQVDEAIEDCKRAIQEDPEFGNPYNDIGSYLIRKGELDEAIPWLERAKKARRYEPRHFPYLNLGRIYISKQLFRKALAEFRGALAIQPDDATAQEAIRTLTAQLN